MTVYRDDCHNPQCAQGPSRTCPRAWYPTPGTGPKPTCWRCKCTGGGATYRRTGEAPGVASLTAWRWVSAWGLACCRWPPCRGGQVQRGGGRGREVRAGAQERQASRPDAALAVRLPGGGRLDLDLCISPSIPPTMRPCAAILLAVRVKGYHPQVVVTKLRQDYEPCRPGLSAGGASRMHLPGSGACARDVKAAYGRVRRQHPEARYSSSKIYDIFAAETGPGHRTLRGVVALREKYVQARSAAAAIFDYLARHWPKLSKASKAA